MSTYIHVIEGRIRVRVESVKGSPSVAARIEQKLLAIQGVTAARANVLTGNVLIMHEPRSVTAAQILDEIPIAHHAPLATPKPNGASISELESAAGDALRYLVKVAAGAIVQELVAGFLF